MEKNEVKSSVKLTIEQEPYLSMMKCAHMFSPDECSGTGLVERIDYADGSIDFVVRKIFVPNQHNTATTTDMPEDEIAKVHLQLIKDDEDVILHRFHWHSHVDMAVFHSTTDDENYDEMQTGDYAISLVVNKKYDMLGSIHLYKPLRIDVLNIEIDAPKDLTVDDCPEWLVEKLDLRKREIVTWQEANKPKRPSVFEWWKGNRKYDYDSQFDYDDEWRNDPNYYEGIDEDPDFLQGLQYLEQVGYIELMYVSNELVGYINTRTREFYELITRRDLTFVEETT